MSTEVYFIYDSHCPWSYACTPLVAAINKAFPKIKIHLMHAARFDGEAGVEQETLAEVQSLSDVQFSKAYLSSAQDPKDSTLAANLLSWVEQKSHRHNLPLLQAMQQAHFIDNNDLTTKQDVETIVNNLKLSAPGKCLQVEKFTKDAEYALADLDELQEMIGTEAIPALLLANEDELVMLNHNLYIGNPDKIVEAIKLELNT